MYITPGWPHQTTQLPILPLHLTLSLHFTILSLHLLLYLWLLVWHFWLHCLLPPKTQHGQDQTVFPPNHSCSCIFTIYGGNHFLYPIGQTCSFDFRADSSLTPSFSSLIKSCHLYITKIQPFLLVSWVKSLVHSLVIPCLNYCNLLLYGLPLSFISHLISVQNSSAKFFDPSCHSYVTSKWLFTLYPSTGSQYTYNPAQSWPSKLFIVFLSLISLV